MNIVLIGFKASGKTTVGASLAELSQRSFIDTDRLLEQQYFLAEKTKLSCKEIYTRIGESAFRQQEQRLLKDLVSMKRMVIATGGGIVNSKENAFLLKHCGIVVFLDTQLELIEERLKTVQSPLFKQCSLQELYRKRLPLYQKLADYQLHIEHNEPATVLANRILSLISE